MAKIKLFSNGVIFIICLISFLIMARPLEAQNKAVYAINDGPPGIRYITKLNALDGEVVWRIEDVYQENEWIGYLPEKISVSGDYIYVMYGGLYLGKLQASDGAKVWVKEASVPIGATKYFLRDIAAPIEINYAQASISHQYTYDTEEDSISDEPVLMNEIWKWFVGNHIDTGEEMADVKFTATCPFSVNWGEGDSAPSFINPPIYVWDYGVDLPENTIYSVGGWVEPGAALSSRLRATRQVVPETLDTIETIQTVTAEVIFVSLPPKAVTVNIASVNSFYQGLIATEIISQNDLPDWGEYLDYGRAAWGISPDRIQLNVPYIFVAQIRSIKSPRVIGNPVWKPRVGINAPNDAQDLPVSVDKSYTLTHPDGVKVTFGSAGNIGWRPWMDVGGIEVAMSSVYTEVPVAPSLDPIGDKTVNEAGSLIFAITGDDPNDDDILTYSATNLPEWASFDPDTQTFSWTPNYNQAGTYPNIHFEVNDGALTDSEDITITVRNTNRAPIISPIPIQETPEGGLFSIDLAQYAGDPDTDRLRYSFDTGNNPPEGMGITPEGLLTWTPDYNQEGTYAIGLIVSDIPDHPDDYLSASFTVNITVISVNDRPQMQYVRNIRNFVLVWLGHDREDRNNLRYSYRVDNGSWSSPTYSVSMFILSLARQLHLDPGNHTFHVRAIDSKGAYSEPKSTKFTVSPNRPPKILFLSVITRYKYIAWYGRDHEDGANLKYSYSIDNGLWSEPAKKTYIYTKDIDTPKGWHTFTVKAIDTEGAESPVKSVRFNK